MNDPMRTLATPEISRMKPTVCILLGAMMMQSLAGCGGGSTSAVTTNPGTITAPTTVPATTATTATPAIATTSPVSIQAGAAPFTLTISGANFGAASTVSIDGTAAPVTHWNATQLAVTVSAAVIASARTVAITVTNPAPGGGTSNSMSLTVTSGANSVPANVYLGRSCVAVGASTLSLSLGGQNFVAGSVLRWNGSNRPTTVASSTQLVATIPASDLAAAGTALVTVFNPAPGGGGSSPVPFAITAGGFFRPGSVAVDPTGRFAYVMDVGCSDSAAYVSTYSIDPVTGALASIGPPLPTHEWNSDRVTVDPLGRFVYVTNQGDCDPWDVCLPAGYSADYPSVSAYTIDATTGALAFTGKSTLDPFIYTNYSRFTVVHPSGRFAYVTNGDYKAVSMYAIDALTGALTSMGTIATPGASTPMAIHPSGKFAYGTNSGSVNVPASVSTYTVDATTGNLESTGTVATGSNPSFIAIHPAGKFAYVMNYSSNSDIWMYGIDASTGALTSIGTVAAGSDPGAIRIHPSGKFAYVANYRSNEVSMYAIDATTGAMTSTGTIAAGSGPASIAIHPTGKFAYVTNNGSNDIWTYAIDASTGTLSLMGKTGT